MITLAQAARIVTSRSHYHITYWIVEEAVHPSVKQLVNTGVDRAVHNSGPGSVTRAWKLLVSGVVDRGVLGSAFRL